MLGAAKNLLGFADGVDFSPLSEESDFQSAGYALA
jgi:hypothetical protein